MCVCVLVTWKVCWGCWGPRLRSDLVSCSHHAVGSEIRSEVYDFLLEGNQLTEDRHFLQRIVGN